MSGQYCTRAMFYQHHCRARDAAADCSLQSLMSVISELSARHWNSAPRHFSAVQCTDTAAMQKKGLVGNVGKCNAMQKKGLGNMDKCTSFTSRFCCDPPIMSRKSYPPHILAAKWAEEIMNIVFERETFSTVYLWGIIPPYLCFLESLGTARDYFVASSAFRVWSLVDDRAARSNIWSPLSGRILTGQRFSERVFNPPVPMVSGLTMPSIPNIGIGHPRSPIHHRNNYNPIFKMMMISWTEYDHQHQRRFPWWFQQ